MPIVHSHYHVWAQMENTSLETLLRQTKMPTNDTSHQNFSFQSSYRVSSLDFKNFFKKKIIWNSYFFAGVDFYFSPYFCSKIGKKVQVGRQV